MLFQRIFGKNERKKKREYPLLKMVNPDLIVMDMEAFRRSVKVKEQAIAARNSYPNEK